MNVVYFAQRNGRIKIGTTGNLTPRLTALGVTLLAAEPGHAVAAALRVSARTVNRWAIEGLLPYIRTPGGRRRFRRSDVEALMNRKQRRWPWQWAADHGFERTLRGPEDDADSEYATLDDLWLKAIAERRSR